MAATALGTGRCREEEEEEGFAPPCLSLGTGLDFSSEERRSSFRLSSFFSVLFSLFWSGRTRSLPAWVSVFELLLPSFRGVNNGGMSFSTPSPRFFEIAATRASRVLLLASSPACGLSFVLSSLRPPFCTSSAGLGATFLISLFFAVFSGCSVVVLFVAVVEPVGLLAS